MKNALSPEPADPMRGPREGPHLTNALLMHAQRPAFAYDPSLDASMQQQRMDFRGMLRAQRPQFSFPNFFHPMMGGPIMQPGGGTTGAPLPPQPPQQQTPMQQPTSYQFPTY